MKYVREQAPLIKARHNIRFRNPFSRQAASEADEPATVPPQRQGLSTACSPQPFLHSPICVVLIIQATSPPDFPEHISTPTSFLWVWNSTTTLSTEHNVIYVKLARAHPRCQFERN